MNGIPMMVDRGAMVTEARSLVQTGLRNIEVSRERNTAHVKRLSAEIEDLRAADLRWLPHYAVKAVRDRLGIAEIELAACRLTLGRLDATGAELRQRAAAFEDATRRLQYAPPDLA